MRLIVWLALACAACQSAPLFSQCKYTITPAPAADVYHVDSNELTTCGEEAYPQIGLTMASDGNGYGLAIFSRGLAIHVQGENGFSADFDSFGRLNNDGYPVETTGLIHLSLNVPHAVIEFPGGRAWSYVLTDGPAPVAFTSP